jgi:SH3-like domain-containing protein
VHARPGSPRHAPARPQPAAPPPAPAAAAPAPAPAPEAAAEPARGTVTGLPIPRFAALRSEEVNLRAGPGLRYPIEWVYKRRDLPVQIEREFEVWRLIRDQEGVKGWVHQATLAPRRTAVVIGGEQVLRQSADAASGPVARVKPGVILRLRSCEAGSDWCEAQIEDYRGWIRRSEIWGTLPGEAVQ